MQVPLLRSKAAKFYILMKVELSKYCGKIVKQALPAAFVEIVYVMLLLTKLLFTETSLGYLHPVYSGNSIAHIACTLTVS